MSESANLIDRLKNMSDEKREALKIDLSMCTDKQREMFKRMYAHWAKDVAQTGVLPTEEMLAIPIEEVVDNMPEGRLDWAMQQVSRSLENNGH
jgi:hypothetical protein